ncbi:uncharacterized protein [Drosophila takahashii]|uniref:uncharacterized protein n=1 Tax=Drosophila takahashii TaxID=29030 RepID=UPI001CF836FC|nr:uncharacterized protein LOC108065110 [Drosophila takahashii]
MPFGKLSFEMHKLKISDHPIEGIKFNGTIMEDLGVKRQPMKQKFVLRKPRIHCLYGKTRANGLDWVHKTVSIEKDEEEYNWVKITGRNKVSAHDYDIKDLISECENLSEFRKTVDLKNLKEISKEELNQVPAVQGVLGSANSYDFKNLISECENLEGGLYYDGTPSLIQNPDEVNVDELACYLENMANIPKKLSSMAEMMYT